MRFLIDTNIVIPAEPTGPDGIEATTPIIAELLNLISGSAHSVCIHPVTRDEIRGDKDERRSTTRLALLEKYPVLENPPPRDETLATRLKLTDPGVHTLNDLTILSALLGNCADYLVTEDSNLRKRAKRLGLSERVLSAADAVGVLRGLFPSIPLARPHVTMRIAYELKVDDPIFTSFDKDYGQKDFRDWLAKCQLERRTCWTIEHRGEYGGICIINPEQDAYGLQGRVLKLCTFKVGDNARGFKYGELLLKAIFDYAHENAYGTIFVEIFQKQSELIELLMAFGFDQHTNSEKGELVFVKELVPPDDVTLASLPYHIKFGPRRVLVGGEQSFIIPIKPKYHRLLFPKEQAQLSLIPEDSKPFGNSIRKAYLCHSNITKVRPGSPLLFYRSVDSQAISEIGVAEATLRSSDPSEIARFVGRRTVYTFDEITEMARTEVLAIQFRHARTLPAPIGIDSLKQSGIVKRAPQSIMTLPTEAEPWLKNQLIP